MTIPSDDVIRVQYNGNSVTTAFAFNNRVLDNTHLQVITEVLATGVMTTLALTTDYTVDGVGGETATVNTVVPVATGTRITIAYNIPLTQTADYTDNDPFPAQTHENALDKLTLQQQQQKDQIDRSLKFGLASSTALTPVLRDAPVDGQFLGWVGTDGTVGNYILGDFVEDIEAAFVSPAINDFILLSAVTPAIQYINKTAAQVRTILGLGALALLNSINLATQVTGILPFANGGTNAATSQAALTSLGITAAFKNRVLSGLVLSNNGSDATNDLDISAGTAVSDDGTTIMVYAGGTIQTDVVFDDTGNKGLDTGVVGNNTYHIWLITDPVTNTTKVVASLSATAPTLLAAYTKKKLIGSIIRTGGAIKVFKQIELGGGAVRTTWDVQVADVNNSSPGTSANTATLASIPTGRVLMANIFAHLSTSSGAGNGLVTALDQTDTTPSATVQNFGGDQNNPAPCRISVKTNTSAQVRYRQTSSNSPVVKLMVDGFDDARAA